jgi:hypothetical protein
MIVSIFGNPDLPQDSLPLRILPALKERFPGIDFRAVDPNEEWEVPEELVAIDAVAGIKRVQVFTDLKKFRDSPRLTSHDFDALANLKYLKKLGKIKRVRIIGIPFEFEEQEALAAVSKILSASQP